MFAISTVFSILSSLSYTGDVLAVYQYCVRHTVFCELSGYVLAVLHYYVQIEDFLLQCVCYECCVLQTVDYFSDVLL